MPVSSTTRRNATEELVATGFCSHIVLLSHYLMVASHILLSIHFTPLIGVTPRKPKPLVILMLSLFQIHINHTHAVYNINTHRHTVIYTHVFFALQKFDWQAVERKGSEADRTLEWC